MVLFLTLDQRRFEIDVKPDDTVTGIKTKIYLLSNIPSRDQRFVFRGNIMGDNETFKDIEEDATVHVVMRLRGMISTFTHSDPEDPLVQYLMLTDEERAYARPPLDALRDKFSTSEAREFLSFKFIRDGKDHISEAVCEKLSAFLDFIWDATTTTTPRVDLRMCLSDELFMKLVGDKNPDLMTILVNFFHQIPGTFSRKTKIALRISKGPTDACINFHCDGGYATGTVQIALNNLYEYKGGKLCFFVNGRLDILDRPRGSISQHPAKVLHGVTALTYGTRKSLFVVDESNGLGDDHDNVLTVTEDHVHDFLVHNHSSL